MTNCEIADNSATNWGGGIYHGNGTATITNCTIARNSTTNSCGGIFSWVALTLNNTIVAGNSAGDTPYSDIYCGGTLSGFNNLIGTGSAFTNGVNGNIVGADPGFVNAANGDCLRSVSPLATTGSTGQFCFPLVPVFA